MEWKEIFAMQKILDDRIIAEHHLENDDRIPWRVTAFIVELSEFANEARWFKKWSNDQDPRRSSTKECSQCNGTGYEGSHTCRKCDGSGAVKSEKDPLLEEYVDAVHFLVGIGLELHFTTFNATEANILEAEKLESSAKSLDELFQRIIRTMLIFSSSCRRGDRAYARDEWTLAFILLRILGWRFGITDDDIIRAYNEKHEINNQRQDRGY